jgi:hypothetical protein
LERLPEEIRVLVRSRQLLEPLAAATPRGELLNEFAHRQVVRIQSGYDTGSRVFFDCYP